MTRDCSRRDFLKFHLKGALWLAGASAGLGAGLGAGLIPGAPALAEGIPDLAVAKGKPGPAARAAVELMGGMKRFVRPGQKVVIKPNMSFPAPPERASNTHPDVVRELALMCREAGAAQVAILDNPLASADRCLEAAGIREALTNVDGASVRMIEDPSLFHETDLVQGTLLKKTDIMRPVLEADVLIAAPVAKSHSGAGVSLSMKGMMGLIQDRIVMHRLNLAETIVDVASRLKPHLVVIDATRVLSTGGPGGPGTVIPAGTVIASTDMVAADAYTVSAFEWYGQKYRPDQVRHIRVAHERGLGRMDWENLRVQTVTV